MIRIYYQTLCVLYLSYFYVRYCIGFDNALKELAQRAPTIRASGMLSNNHYEVLTRLLDDVGGASASQIMDDLSPLVLNRPTEAIEAEDLNFIEIMAQLVRKPFMGNRLPLGWAPSLRKALCNPTELSSLNQKLRESELRCYGCGHTFLPYEMVTLYQDPFNKNDVGLLCHRCRLPEVVGCHHCGSAVALHHSTLAKKLARKRWYCNTHERPENRLDTLGPQTVVLTQEPGNLRIYAPLPPPPPTQRMDRIDLEVGRYTVIADNLAWNRETTTGGEE